MKKFAIVRHGECEANLHNRLAGSRNDSPLTKNGIRQARETGRALLDADIKLDRIISSPLSRAKDTARIIADELGYNGKIEEDNRIIERDFGSATDQPMTATLFDETDDMEQPVDLYNRLKDFFKDVSGSNENILIVTHGGVSHMISIIFNQAPGVGIDDFFKAPKLGNAEFWMLDINDAPSIDT